MDTTEPTPDDNTTAASTEGQPDLPNEDQQHAAQSTDEQSTDDASSEDSPSEDDHPTTDEQPSDDQPPTQDQSTDEQPSDDQPSDDQPSDDQQPTTDQSTDEQSNDHASEQQPNDEQNNDEPSADESSSDELTGFSALDLRPELLAALNDLGYEEPTPIQQATIPPLIAGSDLLGQAATGTGKTAAFALPILQLIDTHRGRSKAPSALVLVPTRELAMQVSEAIFNYGRHLGVRVVPIYGGQPIYRQLQQLDRGVHVVVATPGRAVDHIGRGSLPLDDVRIVVLDEADEMLDMGFADDLEAILGATPDDRQTVLFSATLPSRINSIARKYQRDPVRIQIGKGDSKPGTQLVRQSAYVVQRAHKAAALGRILDVESPTAAIVFCRTRGEVDQLTVTMNGRGYRAEALHGGMDQHQRDRVMARLRDGTAELLIATDVAARGLDIDSLTHVVNYDVPSAPESYVHRIGRVGRAGREGVAITLAEPREQRQLGNIERLTKQQISLETVPTVADLKAQRLSQTIESIRETLESDDLDDYQQIIDQLAVDHDPARIALAAAKLAHDAEGAADDDTLDIPDARRYDKGNQGGKPNKKGNRGKPQRGSLDDRGRDNSEPTAYLYVSMGRHAGMRPGDLVGAIANEVGLEGRQIGPIRIADKYSVVGIPQRALANAITVLNGTTIRGKPTKVREYKD